MSTSLLGSYLGRPYCSSLLLHASFLASLHPLSILLIFFYTAFNMAKVSKRMRRGSEELFIELLADPLSDCMSAFHDCSATK